MRALLSLSARRVTFAVLSLLASGCYDFGALGGGVDAAAPPPVVDLAAPVDLRAPFGDGGCSCAAGENCIADACVTAPATCGALSALFMKPTVATDGVYWLNYAGAAHRAYCDMTTGAILCSNEPLPGARSTRTRDGQSLAVNWTSRMSDDESSCRIWNVRGDDGRPFSPLTQNPQTKLSTCQGLGFVRDVSVGGCAFGMNDTANTYKGTCGFSAGDWLTYYNNCAVYDATTNSGCKTNGGPVGYWRQQGPMFNVGVMSTADGAVTTVCATR